MNKIGELRDKLDNLDQHIMKVISDRQDILNEIAQYKIETAHPLFDREREKKVFEKARNNAITAGLDPDFGERLMQVIVEASHNYQEKILHIHKSNKSKHHRFLIVGGNGGMGKLFHKLFVSCGHNVEISDIEDNAEQRHKKVAEADIIILAVNMKNACEVAKDLCPHVRENALLMDINSLKTDICKVLTNCPGEALGTHPMFGPTTSSLRRQKMVLCPIKPGPLSEWITNEFGHLGLELIQAEPDTHDKIMSIIQVLVHFKTLSMGYALSQCGVSIDETLKYTSPIYQLELTVIGRLFAQRPELYAEIEMSNPHGDFIRQILIKSITHLEKTINSNDKETFNDLFASIAEYFSGFQEKALESSDKLIEHLISQP